MSSSDSPAGPAGQSSPASTPSTAGSSSPDRPRTRKEQRRDELINTKIRPSLHPSTPGGAVIWTAIALAIMWLLVLIDDLDHHHLSSHFSIRPRHSSGLIGIATSPVLHLNASQLAANTVPFVVLCWLMLWSGLRAFGIVTAAVWLFSGGVDWLAGPSDAHILGASGLIFGWMGYILARAFYGRSIKWIAIALVVVLVFFSTFADLLPHFGNNVFWAGHAVSFAIGVLVAAALHRRAPKSRRKPPVAGKAGQA